MKLTANQLNQAIKDKQAQLKLDQSIFLEAVLVNPDNRMSTILQILSDIDQLSEMLDGLKHIQTITVNGEEYTVYQAMRWINSMSFMSGLWSKSSIPNKTSRWCQLQNLMIAFNMALIEAEDVAVDLEIEPVLFLGTSIQPYVDSQVL